MLPQTLLILPLLFSLLLENGIQGLAVGGRRSLHRHDDANIMEELPQKLFVFGNSYVDSGNTNETDVCFHYPYGITFPGKGVGRYSDGHLLSDYVAGLLGLDPPVPYKRWNGGKEELKDGMNFAYGGSGVFETLVAYPNMSTQIDFFKRLVDDKVFSSDDINSSVALVALSGNDYAYYDTLNPTDQEWYTYIEEVVTQLTANLKTIYELGVKKIAVANLEPLGCLPQNSMPYYFKQCNETINALFQYHNELLDQDITALNNDTDSSAFFILDLYDSFLSVLNTSTGFAQGNYEFEYPILRPCCYGESRENLCGLVDENGKKIYILCKDPKLTFFWDVVHPTQEGWLAVYSQLETALHQLYYQDSKAMGKHVD